MKKIIIMGLAVMMLTAALVLLTACGGNSNNAGANSGKKVPITYETNGGEPLASSEETSGAVIDLPTPTREGFDFEGWNTVNRSPLVDGEARKPLPFRRCTQYGQAQVQAV